jgi:copper resistance protein C
MKTSKRFLSVTLMAGLMIAGAHVAWAHSFPEYESPAPGQTVATSPTIITIKYDAPVEKLFDSLKVLNAAGENQAIGMPRLSADGYELSVPVKTLGPGHYTVKWRVVCIDTHHTQGSYSFTVACTRE